MLDQDHETVKIFIANWFGKIDGKGATTVLVFIELQQKLFSLSYCSKYDLKSILSSSSDMALKKSPR